ncbi:uncharacterized protein LOC127860896 [Dreissena polymorpha]|uniref:uncharacterized protein LOC127860896 n=1 Tax=Dreissena polymorpha TaxID=45954 RepID=UPI002264ACAB|nr:uncharacterized protein LOC127860896 [Dreissena polymorpha]
MEWSVRLSAMTLLLLINDEVKGIISGLKCARDSMTKIKVKAGAVCFLLDMENNTNEGNKTGSAFVKKWSSYVEVRTSSPASTVDLQSSDESFNESAIELMNMDFLDQSDAEIGIMKEDDTAAKGKHENEAQQKYLGLFDVHIDNLVPPTPKRTSRLLDLQHVKFLMDSFQSGFTNQLTILVGMVPERCDTTMLKTKGAVQVETLGGNHTREALQSLIRRGQSKLSTVKVNVYSLLSTATALTVGWQHNVVLQEKQKPITFVDKVRLMRQVPPSNPLTPADMKSWKGLLSSIFQVKDVRRFQQVYGIHLKTAQLDQNIWAMVEDVSESAIKINEKFFRPLVKLSDVEVKTCLEILKRLGLAEYNKKVKEFSPASSKKRKIEDGSTCDKEERNQYEDLLGF